MLATASVAPAQAADPEPTDTQLSRRASSWLHGGILAMMSGVLLGTGAAIIGGLDPCHPRSGNSCMEDARARAALTMGIPSALMLGSGVAMIVASAVQKRRLQRRSLAVFGGVDRRGRGYFAISSRF